MRRQSAPLSPAEMRALGAHRTRAEVEASAIYRRLLPRIRALTWAVEYEPAERAPAASVHDGFVRALSWNIERGMGLDGVKAVLGAHPLCRNADIIMLNEVDAGMARSGNLDIPRELCRHLGMHLVFGNGYLSLGYGGPPDGPVDEPNRVGMHGNAILSRFPLEQAEVFSLPEVSDRYACPDRRLGHKKATWARARTPLGPLTVASVHLDSNTSPAGRGWQMRGLLRHLADRVPEGPLLLGGDLNSSTLDFSSLASLAADMGPRMLRGGPRAVMAQCRRPEEEHERPLFEALEAAGLAWRGLTPPEVETCRFEADELEDAVAVMSFPPAPVIRLAARALRRYGGMAPFKLDWFAARGLRTAWSPDTALPAWAEARAARLPGAAGAAVIPRPSHGGRRISDHDPILLDFTL